MQIIIIKIHEKHIKVSSSVKRLGDQKDHKLSFNLYITNICKSTANQANVLIRLKKFLGFEAKIVLVNITFIRI